MSCNLNKFKTYQVSQVVEDRREHSIMMKILDPPPGCPDGSFTTHKGKIVVNAYSQPTLTWNARENRPVITVPSRATVVQPQKAPTVTVNESDGWGLGGWLLFFVAMSAIGGLLMAVFRMRAERRERNFNDRLRRFDDEYDRIRRAREREVILRPDRVTNTPRTQIPEPPRSSYVPPPLPAPTAPTPRESVHHHHHGGGMGAHDLATGMMLGSMLGRGGGGYGHDHTREIIREREVLPQRSHHVDRDYDADEMSSSNYTDDSFSSEDTGSSFSSDSDSDSFSSDSDSDFSSDSGGDSFSDD